MSRYNDIRNDLKNVISFGFTETRVMMYLKDLSNKLENNEITEAQFHEESSLESIVKNSEVTEERLENWLDSIGEKSMKKYREENYRLLNV
jgi:hypothetical protein